MLLDEFSRSIPVVTSQGRHNRLVQAGDFLDVGETARVSLGHETLYLGVEGQPGAYQMSVTGPLADETVELEVEGGKAHHIPRLACLVHLVDEALEEIEMLGIHCQGSTADGELLDEGPDLKQLFDLVNAGVGNEGTNAGLTVYQAVSFEAVEGFTDGGEACPHLGGDFKLDNALARLQFAGDNRSAEMIVDLIDQRDKLSRRHRPCLVFAS
ncbi:MAG: hypothetical protein U0822_19400 [Anaerolineae bacterium]